LRRGGELAEVHDLQRAPALGGYASILPADGKRLQGEGAFLGEEPREAPELPALPVE
jgi:hypothetical protein